MKTETQQINGGYVTYRMDQETKEALFEILIDWFFWHEAFDGESIIQCDGPNLYSCNVLGDIAEDILKFDITHEDE